MDRDSRRAKAAELVEKYGPALFRLCLVMLRNAADAEDAVQEALLRYIERAPEFESAGAERAWLFTVASNRCRDSLRAARRHPQLTLDELAGLGCGGIRAGPSGRAHAPAGEVPPRAHAALVSRAIPPARYASMTGRTPSCAQNAAQKGPRAAGKGDFRWENKLKRAVEGIELPEAAAARIRAGLSSAPAGKPRRRLRGRAVIIAAVAAALLIIGAGAA